MIALIVGSFQGVLIYRHGLSGTLVYVSVVSVPRFLYWREMLSLPIFAAIG